MKLINCYVSSFGNLKNFSYDFGGGLNTVKEENGWGKSTLAAFIKCMFYGINDSKHTVAENERLKYRPWNSIEKFGGNLVFYWGDKTYRIERFFGNRQSEDSVRLFDDETGREYANNQNLGYRVFEIDEAGFFSTTYLSQKDLEIKSNTSLTAKFNSNNGNDAEQAIDKALIKVESKRKEYKADRGDAGKISETRQKIYFKDDEIAKAKGSASTVSALKKKIGDLSDKISLLKAESERLSNLLRESGRTEAIKIKRENLATFKAELEKAETDLIKYDKVLLGNEVTAADIETCRRSIKALGDLTKNKENIERELFTFARAEERPAKKSKPIYPLFIFILLAVFGVVAIFSINDLIGIICTAFGAVLSAVYGFIYFKSAGKTSPAVFAERAQKETQLAQSKSVIAECESGLNTYFSRFNLEDGSFDFKLEKIRAAKEGRDAVTATISALSERIAEIEKELKNSDNSATQLDGAKIRAELAAVTDELNDVTAESARTREQINFSEDSASKLPLLMEEKDGLLEELKQQTEEYEILKLTAKYLKVADDNLKAKYKAPLEESLDKYISLLSGGKIKATIDVDLKVSVVSGGRNYDTDYMSKGYKNLIDICKRFALSEVLFKKEKPFMILDDPFTNLDEEKIEKGRELLKKLAEEFQIIYLVCHDSRKV